MNVLLVIVHICVARISILEHSAPEVIEGTNVIPWAEPLAPQVWGVLRRCVSGKAIRERVG
jgi:hypothetical protein